MWNIVTVEIFFNIEEVYMWCPQMVRHIQYKNKMKNRTGYLVEMDYLSNGEIRIWGKDIIGMI